MRFLKILLSPREGLFLFFVLFIAHVRQLQPGTNCKYFLLCDQFSNGWHKPGSTFNPINGVLYVEPENWVFLRVCDVRAQTRMVMGILSAIFLLEKAHPPLIFLPLKGYSGTKTPWRVFCSIGLWSIHRCKVGEVDGNPTPVVKMFHINSKSEIKFLTRSVGLFFRRIKQKNSQCCDKQKWVCSQHSYSHSLQSFSLTSVKSKGLSNRLWLGPNHSSCMKL